MKIKNELVTDYSDYNVAAFVNGECRGIAVEDSEKDHKWLYIRIRSNSLSGEIVSFKIYDKKSNRTIDVEENLIFEHLGLIGKPTSPKLLTLKKYSINAAPNDVAMGSIVLEGGGDAVESGTLITATAKANRGYEFSNWTVAENIVSSANPYSFEAVANTVLIGNFRAIMYDVTFVVDGNAKTESIAFGSAIQKPMDPVKEGYTFTGWQPEFVEGTTVPEGGITYTAQWSVNQYTIAFDGNGGTVTDSITQDYGTAITPPANPTKEGHTFIGWEPEIPATMPAQDLTVKATWKVNQYDVIFNVDGTENKTTQDYGTVITALEAPAKEGYTFAGWQPEFVEGTTVPEGGITYTAQWSVNQYTIAFDGNGGTVTDSITQDYGTAIIPPVNPTKEGHTFIGWEPEIPATMPAQDLTVKATWKVNQYDVIFNVDGTEIKMTQDYGSVIVPPENPTKEGTTFAGWIPEFIEGTTVPEGGVTYTAKWSTNQYVITFDTDGGSAVSPIIQDYGTAITPPENPTKEGHAFLGWEPEIPATMPAQDLTVKATWQVNQYHVIFNVDGTENKTTQDYGTVITAPETPTKEGYTFAGWQPEFVEGTTVPEGGITYTATWEANDITITFDSNGGSEVPSITQKTGTPVTKPEDPTRDYYIFLGWNDTIPSTMPTKDITLTALWEVNVELVKEEFTTLINSIKIVSEDSDADEVIRQSVPYDYEAVAKSYHNALNAISIQNADTLLSEYLKAKEDLKEYKDYCTTYGHPQSYGYTLSDNWGTLVLPFGYVAPKGYTFYQVNTLDENGTHLKLEEAMSPEANKPYLVQGEAGKKIQFIGHVPEQVENVTEGLLTGILEADYTPSDKEYILMDVDGTTAFHRVNETMEKPVVKVTNCYLTLPTSQDLKDVIYIEKGSDGIEDILLSSPAHTRIYNLSGQRLQQFKRGINIVGNKKIFVK